MTPIFNDLDLADLVSKHVGECYREAVEFSTVLPSYALVRFRDALDGLCDHLAKEAGLNQVETSLFEKINRLRGTPLEGRMLQDCLHRARKLCNKGAHRTSAATIQEGAFEFQPESEKLAQYAEEVRRLVLQGMEFLYCEKFSLEVMPAYVLIAIDTQHFKDVLYAATVGKDAAMKFKAGLICEGEADRRRAMHPALILTTEFANELRQLRRLAAMFYQSSFLIKPNVEAEFRYAQFVEQGLIDGDKKEQAIEMIGRAADSGLGEACYYYGAILYEDKSDYANAERLWLKAVKTNAPRAYCGLWDIYASGTARAPDLEKAMAFLRLGAEQGDSACMQQLGRCYHEGLGVEKDDNQARLWLQKAIDEGNIGARYYLTMKVEGEADRIANQFALLGHLLSGKSASASRDPDPYDPCPCESGKKYKWCCKGKDFPAKIKVDVFGRRIR
ncbi:hypothetical protein WS75_22835 [Burkholderia sp. FL-7-2-10-S1-D7]|nr:hypothetical protein WS75_22835 [Burkholderia sp. FL-7-2-10-S1-D7]